MIFLIVKMACLQENKCVLKVILTANAISISFGKKGEIHSNPADLCFPMIKSFYFVFCPLRQGHNLCNTPVGNNVIHNFIEKFDTSFKKSRGFNIQGEIFFFF